MKFVVDDTLSQYDTRFVRSVYENGVAYILRATDSTTRLNLIGVGKTKELQLNDNETF